jgi:hypothetical protein
MLMLGQSVNILAQNYDSYNLGSYKTPDIKRSSLDFQFNSHGEFTTNQSSKDAYLLNGMVDTEFKKYVNNRRFIGEQIADFGIHGYSSSGGTTNSNKSRYFSLYTTYSNSSKIYNSDNSFWKIGGNFSFMFTNNKSDPSALYKSLQFNIAPQLGIGWGRIEPVQDARQAVYILDELSKKGVITTHLSDDEVNRFAQVISSVKNKRFLDSRLHLIDEVSKVDSFLVYNGYTQESGAKYFTTLYDYWMYGCSFSRDAGSEISAEIIPQYSYNKQYARNLWDDTKGVSAKISYKYEKPVNLYWQRSAFASVTANYSHFKLHNEFDNTYDSRWGNVAAGYSIGYYPNSRTNLNLGINESVILNDEDKIRYRSLTNLALSAYYYISPQFRLSGNTSLTYDKTNSMRTDYSNKWMGNYSLTFTYSFF